MKESNAFRAILFGGLLAGVLACVSSYLTSGIGPVRIFQSVASGVIGRASAEGVVRHFSRSER